MENTLYDNETDEEIFIYCEIHVKFNDVIITDLILQTIDFRVPINVQKFQIESE